MTEAEQNAFDLALGIMQMMTTPEKYEKEFLPRLSEVKGMKFERFNFDITPQSGYCELHFRFGQKPKEIMTLRITFHDVEVMHDAGLVPTPDTIQ